MGCTNKFRKTKNSKQQLLQLANRQKEESCKSKDVKKLAKKCSKENEAMVKKQNETVEKERRCKSTWNHHVITYLQRKQDMGITEQLYAALESHSCQTLANILENNDIDGSSVRARDTGETPLHLSAINACVPCSHALLNHQFTVDSQTLDGVTPLMLSCEAANKELCDLLLRHGAQTELSDRVNGETALHIATRMGHIDGFACTKLLLKKGANPNAQSLSGKTPLHIAVHELAVTGSGEFSALSVLTDFLRCGAKPDIKGRSKDVLQGSVAVTAFELALLLQNEEAIVAFSEAGFRIPQQSVGTLVKRYDLHSSVVLPGDGIHSNGVMRYLQYRLSRPQSLMSLCKRSLLTGLRHQEDIRSLRLPECLVAYSQDAQLLRSCEEVITIINDSTSHHCFSDSEYKLHGMFPHTVF